MIVLTLVLLALTMLPLNGCAANQPGSTSNSSTDGEVGNTPLRVMTFNIRYGTANDGENHWNKRDHLVKAVIADHQPDIIGLQEALSFQLEELAHEFTQYTRIGVGRSDGVSTGEHCAILFRTQRFSADEQGTFWFSATPELPGSTSWGNGITRICTWVRLIDRETRQAFYVYNIHLDHQSQPSRERSTELLVQRIAQRTHGDPFIVTGDFNAGPANPAVLTMGAATGVAEMIDCYRAIKPMPTEGEGTFNSFRGEHDGERIDYIFCSPELAVDRCLIVHDNDAGQYPSDHCPVVADLEIPSD